VLLAASRITLQDYVSIFMNLVNFGNRLDHTNVLNAALLVWHCSEFSDKQHSSIQSTWHVQIMLTDNTVLISRTTRTGRATSTHTQLIFSSFKWPDSLNLFLDGRGSTKEIPRNNWESCFTGQIHLLSLSQQSAERNSMQKENLICSDYWGNGCHSLSASPFMPVPKKWNVNCVSSIKNFKNVQQIGQDHKFNLNNHPSIASPLGGLGCPARRKIKLAVLTYYYSTEGKMRQGAEK